MRRSAMGGRAALASILVGAAMAAACGGGDDTNGGNGSDAGSSDATTGDGSFESDGSTRDAGTGDGGSDSATTCTSTPCVIQIAAAGDDTCALLSDKTIRCWGFNRDGQLGVGTTDDGGFDAAPYSTPNPVPGRTGIDEIAIGDFYNENAWLCTRSGSSGVSCWGNDQYGELGRGDASTYGDAMPPHPEAMPVIGIGASTEVSLAGGHSCALTPSGNVACWGYTIDFALGRATTGPFAAGDLVEGGTANYASVVAGEAHNCALTKTGTVDCWGWNSYLQLGRPDAGAINVDGTITPVADLSNVVQLVAGQRFYCARTAAGAVDCWGENDHGELGRGSKEIASAAASPVSLPAGRTARLIGAGQFDACAVLDDDTLWCWGQNSQGTLGSFDDDAGDSSIDGGADSVPRQVNGITGNIVQIAGGLSHMCVLTDNGAVTCWGGNGAGQLGRGAGAPPDDGGHPDPQPVAF